MTELAGASPFRRNFASMFAANVVYAACQWGVLTILVKLGSATAVGQFALGLSIVAPIIILCDLSLRAVQTTDSAGQFPFSTYFGMRLITIGCAIAAVESVALLGNYSGQARLAIAAVGLAKGCESLAEIFYGALQRQERMGLIARSMFAKGAVALVAMGCGIAFFERVWVGALFMAAGWAIIALFHDMRCTMRVLGLHHLRNLLEGFSLADCRKLLKVALPLGFVGMLTSVNLNMPRYMTERRLGEHELGIFASLAYFLTCGTMVVAALGQAAIPRLARFYAQGQLESFGRVLRKMLGIGIVLGVAGVLIAWSFGREILTIVYRPEYAARTDVLVILFAAGTISYVGSFLGYAIAATREFTSFMVPYSILTVINFFACYFLVDRYGLSGAAWATGVYALGTCIAPVIIFARINRPILGLTLGLGRANNPL